MPSKVRAQRNAPEMLKTRLPFHEWPLLFAVLLDMVGFGMVLPDIQTRLERLGATGLGIGSILAAYFLVQMAVSPLWGRLSDRIGRKPVLLLCGAFSASSMLLYGFSDTVWLILLSRVLSGLGGANVVAAQAYLSDTTDGATRTAAMGRMGSATMAGLILGPTLGGLLAGWGGHRLLGCAAFAASAFGVAWIAVGVPPAAPRIAKAHGGEQKSLYSGAGALWRDVPQVRALLLLASVSFFALACLEGTFGRLIHNKLGFGPKEYGIIFSYEAFLGVVVQSTLLAWVAPRVSTNLLLRFAYVSQAVGLALTPFMPNLAALFAASTLYAIGSSFANPTLNSLCSKATPEPRQGEMFGLMQSARSFGFLFGPIIGGVLFDWRPEAPYVLAGAVAFAVGLTIHAKTDG